MIAQNCFLYCLLPTAVASAVGSQTDEIETKFLHANSILEFSHSLGQERLYALQHQSSIIGGVAVSTLRARTDARRHQQGELARQDVRRHAPVRLIPLRSYFQSFQRDIACDLKVRKLAGLHFTGELSPSSGNIAFAHTSVLSSTSFIHLRQLNTVVL